MTGGQTPRGPRDARVWNSTDWDAFAYVMFSVATGEYVGCVYIRTDTPVIRHRCQVRVYF